MKKETAIWLGVIFVVSGASLFVYLRPWEQETPNAPQDVFSMDLGEGAEHALAPNFELTDQSGEKFGSADLRGKVWIVNFIFTRCKATCPAQTASMVGLQQQLGQIPAGSDIHFVSITVDPEHDTRQVLKQYGDEAGADHTKWKFLTGDRAAIWKLSAEGFKMPVSDGGDDSGGAIMHDSKFVLVDRMGRIRGYYEAIQPEGLAGLQQALNLVLPEIVPPTNWATDRSNDGTERTHLAIPPNLTDVSWLDEVAAKQKQRVEQSSVQHQFHFTRSLGDSGIDYHPQIVDEQRFRLEVNHYDHGNGVAVADVNNDGNLDLYFVSQVGPNRLYKNLGDGKFADITAEAGVALADRVGVAAAFGDIDNDGDADLYVTSVRGGNVLFENDGQGHFQNISEPAGVGYVGHSSAAVFFDYNRDGLLDLFVANVGRYTIDEQAMVRMDPTNTLPEGEYSYYLGRPNAFFGHLDPSLSESSVLYRNDGGNKFTNVTEQTGLTSDSWSGAATPLDLNEDGWQDLYVLNMQGEDEYFENIAGERFERRDLFPRTPWGAMGVKSFDYDNDGKFDLYVTDMHSDMSEDVGPESEKLKSNMQWDEAKLGTTNARSIFGNAFFHNQGGQGFQEVSDQIGAENYWPWGLSVGDLNADGYVDAFLVSSMCIPYRYGSNSVLLNEAGKRFVDAEFVVGVEPRPVGERFKPWFEADCASESDRASPVCMGRTGKVTVWSALGSRSAVIFDVDDDGDLDIVTHEFNSEPQLLLSSLSDEKNCTFLKVRLQGSKSNRDALGAVVRVFTGGDALQARVHDGQSGYLGQSSMPLYFGLGGQPTVDRIEVTWPSGQQQTIAGPIDAGQILQITEEAN